MVFNKSLLITTAISILSATIIELLQLGNIVNGTFDILDIILEVSTIILAVMIIRKECSK